MSIVPWMYGTWYNVGDMERSETTSTTLLRAIGVDVGSARWVEFVNRYQPMLESFLCARFPQCEAADILQETFAAVVKALPAYHYDPDEKGHFRNWLIGIARHKAEEEQRRRAKNAKKAERYGAELEVEGDVRKDVDDWRRDAMEAALRQLMSDDSFSDQSRRIFLRVAVNGESPDAVAELYRTTRNNVDQIRSRMLRKLRDLIGSMCDAR